MSKVQCEYCQKWMKTKRGLAQHMKHSTFCQSIKKGLEKIDNDYDESKPNVLDKLGYQKKTNRFDVESTDTLHESYAPKAPSHRSSTEAPPHRFTTNAKPETSDHSTISQSNYHRSG
jgi:ribonucleotide reductase alpha subunit